MPKSKSEKGSGAKDAIAPLKADPRQVEEWFTEFEATDSKTKWRISRRRSAKRCRSTPRSRKRSSAPRLSKPPRKNLHHEVVIEHGSAKELIADIEDSDDDDEYFDAKGTVLSERIKHHVKEEEQPDGMFAKPRESEMNLKELGEQLGARKAQWMAAE